MAEISKQALIVENNQSFPNNNNGQITPSVLRAFNNDMIDSTVNQIVFNNYSSSVTESLQALSVFTASVAGTNAFTASIAGTNAFTQSTDAKVNALIAFTSSVLSISALDPLNNASASLQAYTASMNNYTASNDAKVNSLIQFTSSVLSAAALVPLNEFTASVAGTNAFTASAQLEINALEAFTQSIQAEVDDIQAKTGSFATTGSNLFTGPQTLSDDSLNTSTLATISGSLVLVGKTWTSSSAALAHISASSADQMNLIFKSNSGTQRTIVSGSNNIFTNPSNATAGFLRYVGGSNNFMPLAIPQLTGSAAFPINMGSNIIQSGVILRAPVSSSTYNLRGNLLLGANTTALSLGTSAANNFERAVSGLAVDANVINGLVNAVAAKTSLSASVGISNNNIGGTLALNMDSSSIGFNGSIVQGTLTVNNSYFPTTFNSTTANFSVAQLLNIGGNTLYASGSNTTFTGPPRTIIATSLLGNNNIISASLNGDLAQVHSTHILGQSLTAFGSNSRPAAATAADWGTTFVGRWNSLTGNRARTAETVFVVGTGTAEANRKTGLLIDSGSNTFIEGTLNVSGSTSLTGSVYGNVIPLTISSLTASMDCSLGNFFTLTLANSADTHLAATNIRPGQTINLLVTQGNPTGSISYNSTFDFPSGNAYTASTLVSAKDIVSFISFDSTTLYGTAVKNLV